MLTIFCLDTNIGVLCSFVGLLLRRRIAGAESSWGSVSVSMVANALRLRTEKFEATPEFIPP